MTNKKTGISSLWFLLFLFYTSVKAQNIKVCEAFLKNDTLFIRNDVVFMNFLWNNGNIIRIGLGDVKNNFNTIAADNNPIFDCGVSSLEDKTSTSFHVSVIPANNIMHEHLRVEIKSRIKNLEVMRVIRVYPSCPAFPMELYLRGKMIDIAVSDVSLHDLKNIENDEAKRQGASQTYFIDRMRLSGNHWKARAVEFFDITDRNNNLIQEYDRILFTQECKLRGNLLLLENKTVGNTIFILKEAPSSFVQFYYQGFDFVCKADEIKVAGVGLSPSDLSDSVWTKAYSTAVGISLTNDKNNILQSLRMYQNTIRKNVPERDEMVIMNTWGDRGRDTKVNEAFCFAELEAGAKLGISHLQIDDGWQVGRSGNSAYGGSFSKIWDNPDYWKPDPVKFPKGLHPIVKKGKELGIEISLWFNPSPDNDHADWEKDADAILKIYKEYGVRIYKIDGTRLFNVIAENNYRKMLEKIAKNSNGNVVVNIDVTAGRRGGYHYLNEYGQIFVENRYTDWKNYYPYWTLRNLWMLSQYVPPQNLQIEFLNNKRNIEKYINDCFAPSNYSFEYIFAITMMAQPLAWFEATGLQSEAFQAAPAIKKYREIQNDIHSGIILPIGNEPDGVSWTGFQSINGKKGYILIFREATEKNTCSVKTLLPSKANVSFSHSLGSGKSFKAKVDENGNVQFSLPEKNTYALYQYNIEIK